MKAFPPLESVSQPNLDTEAAAHYLNRKPSTLRIWACNGKGLITPIRIGNRLAWPTAEVRKLVGGAK